ncbi:slit -like protein [Brachionus plicatilis]|uniref:Slit-like protein n=1 Tax=Brachionus plicatilis TaxID=10195 RepID=A0A3M7RZW2_BRAPC|nr:slit -like protein [Brachionus plicatilis]
MMLSIFVFWTLVEICYSSPDLAEFECLESKCWCETMGPLIVNIECSSDLDFSVPLHNLIINQTINYFLIKNVIFAEHKNFFSNLEISELAFDNVQLSSMGNLTFKGIRNLKKLMFKNSILTGIQNGTFSHLDLVDIDFKNCSIDDKFMNENHASLNELSHIAHFTMSQNKLSHLNKNWFKNLKIYFLLNLSFNMITKIDSNFFRSMTALERLNLKFNHLSGCLDQIALLPLRASLVRLILSSNQLSCVPVFDRYPNLRILDLSNNSIETLDNNVFRNLISLNILNLNHNKIKYICSDCFTKSLLYLRLEDNYLKRIPSIEPVSSLILLDLRNQNGHLEKLSNFQFDRRDSLLHLKIHLEQNDLSEFAPRSFCSRFGSYLDNFTLSHRTFVNMFKVNRCLFGQLNYKSSYTVRLFVDNGHLIESKHLDGICTCDFVNFIKLSNVLISGIKCGEFECQSNGSSYFDECVREKIYSYPSLDMSYLLFNLELTAAEAHVLTTSPPYIGDSG